MAQPDLHIVHFGFAGQVVVKRIDRVIMIFGVNEVFPVCKSAGEFIHFIPQHGLPARRIIDLITGDIPIPKTVVRAFCREGVLLLTSAQVFFVFFTISNVLMHCQKAEHFSVLVQNGAVGACDRDDASVLGLIDKFTRDGTAA